MIRLSIGLCWMVFIFCSCGAIRNTPKYAFANGYYKTRLTSQKNTTVYINNENDHVIIYPVTRLGKLVAVDTSKQAAIALPQQYTSSVKTSYVFHKKSFDVDFLTIPFKYRPNVNGFPRQFNANLSGGVYLGYRNDAYELSYQRDGLGRHNRQTTHIGFSVGGFSGFGGTAVNPWVTNHAIAIEYDGVIWTKGVAGIIGLDQFTLGLSAGWDHLLDENRRFWIYQGKPWVGLVFGLNLN